MNTKIVVGLIIVLCVLVIAWSATSAEPDLKGIMQGLRDDMADITDGLLTDDFEKVADGAARIASHPRIPAQQIQLVAAELGPEMSTFKQFDTSVHDLSLSIAAAAESSDRDLAIEGFQQMLAHCLACHAAYRVRVGAVLGAAAEH